jgi:hypothetical protein
MDSPRITWSIPHSIGIAAAAACASLGVAAPSAWADTDLGSAGGLTYIQSDPVPVNATSTGSPVADCPAGTKPVGGGVTPPAGPVAESRINSTYPADVDTNGRPDAWAADVFNISGAQKSFTAFAICKNRGAVARRFKIGSVAGPGAGTVTVKCPEGKHVGGGGAYVAGSVTTGYVNRTHPIDTGDRDSKPDDGWRARLYTTSASTISTTAFVLCVPRSLRYRTATGGAFDSFNDCPEGGHATGGGYSISGDPATAQLYSIYPFAETANPPDAGFYTAAYDSVGDKTPTGYVICK